MSDRDIVDDLRRPLSAHPAHGDVYAAEECAGLMHAAAQEVERLRAERDRYRAALQTIAADRCRLCGAITDTPCRHEGMWMKCERRESATHWDDVSAKQIAQEALRG